MAHSNPERECPICRSRTYAPFASEHIDSSRLNAFSYASRKNPEFMRLRMVRCLRCDLVYAPVTPAFATLHEAYGSSSYDSAEEACYAARTYARILTPLIRRLQHRNCAIDVGAGNGALLPELLRLGFTQVVGIEPSRNALGAAPPDILPHMREGMFSPEIIEDLTPDFVVSCMTLEHIDAPGDFMRTIHASLSPGGIAAVVVHNRKGLLNRALGLRSPIMDIEHLQLFCSHSVQELLKQAGFTSVQVQPFANTYPLRYWLRLAPLPSSAKEWLRAAFDVIRLSNAALTFPVGNILASGKKAL